MIRAFILILIWIAFPAFAAKGRLLQILDQVPCAQIVTGGFDSSKFKFSKEGAKTALSAVNPGDEHVVSRAQAVYTNPQVMRMSGDHLDAGAIHRVFGVSVHSLPELMKRDRGILSLVIRLKGQRTIIGFAQIAKTDVAAAFMNGIAKDRSQWFEISYHLDPEYWGKGLASEVVKTMVNAVMETGAEGVYAQTELANDRAGRVLFRAGFQEFERRKSPSLSGSEGTIHYALTREVWRKSLSRIDLDSLTDELGLSLLIMRTNGQVPTWAVVEIDEAVIESKQVPLPRFGEDRFVQLTSTSKQRSNLGIYVAVPVYDIFGAIYTSTLEIDSIFKECMVRGDLDRRLLQLLMDSRLTNSMRRTLGYDSSVFFPNNFLELTIFEKRRIYEKLEGVVVLDERGRNVVTRAQIIPGAK